MNSNGPKQHKDVHRPAHRISCLRDWSTEFSALNSSPHPLFTSATGRIGVHTAPKYGTKPIRYLTLHFRDGCGEASLRNRNRAAITVLVCEQKPYRSSMIFVAAQKLSGIVLKWKLAVFFPPSVTPLSIMLWSRAVMYPGRGTLPNVSWSGYIWFYSRSRDQETTNGSPCSVEWKSRNITMKFITQCFRKGDG